MAVVSRTGVVAFEIAVTFSYLVSGVFAGGGFILLVKDLETEVPQEALGLAAGLVLAQFFGQIKDVLGEADDGNTAATAGLLEEVISTGYEVLEFVLPQKYGVGRFGQFSP